MSREYWIFADESVQAGTHYSKFFGGCIVPAHHYAEIENRLREKKQILELGKELKWQRVTHQRLEDYKSMIIFFFNELREDRVRVRLMFQETGTPSPRKPNENRHDLYYKLYYQFIKHAFGFAHMPTQEQGVRLNNKKHSSGSTAYPTQSVGFQSVRVWLSIARTWSNCQ